MDTRLSPYAAQNSWLNCTYLQAQQLATDLVKLGVAVIQVYAVASDSATAPDASYSTLISLGLGNTDALEFTFLFQGSDSPQNCALVAADLAPKNYNAIWKVMSDLFPQNSSAMAASAISRLPGIDAFIASALA
jgi:hypothetical protein